MVEDVIRGAVSSDGLRRTRFGRVGQRSVARPYGCTPRLDYGLHPAKRLMNLTGPPYIRMLNLLRGTAL